ncbi:hypothetical protein EYQ95_00900 [Lysobacter sp. N42]|nr:hypothetical protein EYQ95_00900 [Lysobacter sp. N42]
MIKERPKVSQDLIFPLLPRNTKIDLGNDLERVKQLQKKQRIKGVRPEEGGDTQHARIEERQRKMQEDSRRQHEKDQKPEQETQLEHDDDDPKGHNLDTFA